eukprot:FR743154.1.p4 GENE.FR743154.1~~FR743154.1.p4  ORF type:complete len:112 (-),score=48.28 FR743154.1:792-1127(-)
MVEFMSPLPLGPPPRAFPPFWLFRVLFLWLGEFWRGENKFPPGKPSIGPWFPPRGANLPSTKREQKAGASPAGAAPLEIVDSLGSGPGLSLPGARIFFFFFLCVCVLFRLM